MIITNDVVEFEAADFNGLTPDAAKAILVDLRPGTSFLMDCSLLITGRITSAKIRQRERVLKDDQIAELIDKLAAADMQKLDDARPIMDQLKEAVK